MALARNTLAGLGLALILAACSGNADRSDNGESDTGQGNTRKSTPPPSFIPQLASLETDRTETVIGVSGIDAQSFARRLEQEDVRLIDVRTPAEFEQGAIPGAENIPLDMFRPEDFLRADGPDLVLYCRSGRRSGDALAQLEVAGINGAVHLKGGILAWEAEGLPIE
ncbi:MAG: rhodanese-like domain-containing protein, partial [Pseudomonadota bacterium]